MGALWSCWDNVADFYQFVSHNDTVNQQFYQLPSLNKARLVQCGTNLRAEGLYGGCRVTQLNLLVDCRFQLSALGGQRLPFLSQLAVPPLKLRQGHDLGQVGFQQALVLPFQLFFCLVQGVNPGTEFLGQPVATMCAFQSMSHDLRLSQHLIQILPNQLSSWAAGA